MVKKQKILIFQRNGSGESKIKGILEYGENAFEIQVVSIDESLPEIIDDSSNFLPDTIHADLVLDFLTHPDLSHDLAVLCRKNEIPVVASGKKLNLEGLITPPT